MTPTETSNPFQSTTAPDPSAPSRCSVPPPGEDPLGPALEALELCRPEETVALARARLQANPADAFAFAVLGVALCQMGQTAAALQALERAHYLNPHDARILYNYGLVLEAAGRATAARIRFLAALKISPQYTRARERLAHLQVEPPGGAEPKDTAPRPLGPPLERLREDEFQSSWTDGALPKGLADSGWPGKAVSPNPSPLPTAPTNGAASPSVETPAPVQDTPAVTTEGTMPASRDHNRKDQEGRRVITSLVMVQVVAFGLLVVALAYTALRPNSSPSSTSAALAGPTQAAAQSGTLERNTPTAEMGPGGISYRQARLAGRDFRGAALPKADFEKADLSNARLIRADLSGASFVHALLLGADLRKANLERANLLGARLREADLRDADLNRAYLKSAELSNANLTGARLENSILTYAELRQAILTNAQLPGANLRAAVLNRAKLQGATLRGADLQEADLTGADLRGANLDSARLTGAQYDTDTRWPDGLQPSERGAKRVLAEPR